MHITELCNKHEAYVIALRRELHAHPELSLHEERTARRVCEELAAMGVPYELVDGGSIVATIGHGGRRVALRADMDALPVTEETGAEYASQTPGVMHACGHDAHTAMLLGAARVLKELEGELAGTVKLCFQAGEEMNEGAKEIAAHLKATGGVDEVAGLHVWADLEQGKISLREGHCMAGCIGWTVDFEGVGGHSSRPDLTRDPIKPACELVLKLAAIPANRYDIFDPCVVTTGLMKAGTMSNIFPSKASIEGSCRYFNRDGAQELISVMGDMVEGTAKCWGVTGKLNILGYMLPVLNAPECVARARGIVPQIQGLAVEDTFGVLMGSENFSELLVDAPGCFAILGCGNREKGITHGQHHAKFDIDEAVLRKGCEFLVRYALAAAQESHPRRAQE